MMPQTIAHHPLQQPFLVAICTLLILAATSLFFGLMVNTVIPIFANWWLLAVPIPVILLGYHYQERLSSGWRAAFIALMITLIIFFVVLCLQIVISNIATQPEWDLKWFWIHGRAAALGINFYQPEAVHALAAQYGPNTDLFISQLYFWYPPPTMLLMLPLGWFDMQTAFAGWQVVHLGLLVVAIIWLWRLFLPDSGAIGLLFSAVLVVTLHPVIDTVYAGQTNFLLLCLLLLFWRNQHKARAGIWLAAAIFVKPVAAVLILLLLLRRQWSTLGMVFACAALAAVVSVVVFGPTTFMSYFTANPVGNLNTYMLTMPFNQSLLATILRLTHYDLSLGSGFMHPLFLVGAGLLTLSTVWLVYRYGDQRPDWALALVLVLALLVYPHSLRYYAILLVPPILLIWSARERLPGGTGVTILILSLLYGFAAYRPGDFIFGVTLGMWFILAFIMFRLHRQTLPAASVTIQ